MPLKPKPPAPTRDEVQAIIAKADVLIREAHELQRELRRIMIEQARSVAPANGNGAHGPNARKAR